MAKILTTVQLKLQLNFSSENTEGGGGGCIKVHIFLTSFIPPETLFSDPRGRGGGGATMYGLNGDVRPDWVWFSG